MRKIRIVILVLSILIVNIFINVSLAKIIDLSSEKSPIKETYEKRIIIWNFDDLLITHKGVYYNAWKYNIENITKYGGYVGLGFIAGTNETLFHARPQNLTYTQEDIARINQLVSDKNVFFFYHDWNHSWYENPNGSIWTKSLSEQRESLNYTIWTIYNNFGYNWTTFLGGGLNSNYNTTIILSERNILLLAMGHDSKIAQGCKYIYEPHDKIASIKYMNPTDSIAQWEENFTKMYNNFSILDIGSHPNDFVGKINKQKDWANFTEWIYSNHNLINMNYTDAYMYKHDLESIHLDKYNDTNYLLNCIDTFNPMNITWGLQGD